MEIINLFLNYTNLQLTLNCVNTLIMSNYYLGEVSDSLNISMKKISEYLKTKGYVLSVSRGNIIPSAAFDLLVKEFIDKSAKNIKSRSSKNINEKFKPTLGEPGNYSKLIYIRKKT